VLSEARRKTPAATRWLTAVDDVAIFLSVVTLGEIMKGIELRARTDQVAAASLRMWLHDLSSAYGDRILPIDSEVALTWGRIMAQRTRPVADALIAATAVVNRKVLVTRNVAEFADAGVEIIDPWAAFPVGE
jgi:predicted nucleic acid-binding protein